MKLCAIFVVSVCLLGACALENKQDVSFFPGQDAKSKKHEVGVPWIAAIELDGNTYVVKCMCGKNLIAICVTESRAGEHIDTTLEFQGVCKKEK